MPRAVVATAYTGPDGIGVIDVESIPASAGQVVIAVRATALNPWDLKQAKGAMGTDPAKLPMRLGAEASGVVTAMGEDAVGLEGQPLQVGDEVFGYPFAGAQASELTVKAADVLIKPIGVGFEQAAGLLLTGTTAVHGLEAVQVSSGDTLLIHGVSGSVGALAAQLAALRGARIIGTAAPARHDALRALGIVPVAYGDGLLERVKEAAPEGISAALDTVGTDEALAVSLELLDDPSRFVTIANAAAALAAGGQAIGAAPGADRGTEIRSAARLELAKLIGEGKLHVTVSATYPLEHAADAYAELAEGHAGGKIVLTV